MEQLEREIERLEARLEDAPGTRSELATVRRGLAGPREPGLELPNIRLGFACKQRWEDMVGDDRVRACGGCARPVFNLSAMTHDEAAAVLATRGLTPCVRFFRRPDGTVMTSDCPSGARPAPRRLAVVASSLAAGATLAAPVAMADPPAASADADATTTPDAGSGSDAPAHEPITITREILQGIPLPTRTFDDVLGEEVGVMIAVEEKRAPVEWSVWTRLGAGIMSQQPDVVARRVTAPEVGPGSTVEAAATADLTVAVAHHGDLRLGAWGEVRTSSDPVAGAELVLEGLPPHPYDSRIGRTGSLVLRAGANDRIITGAVGFGYVGSFPRYDPWIGWARHVVGARVVVSVNRAIDAPHEWSATLGVEVEPLGAAHALYDLVTR
jgi:hypothetical protein